MQAQTTGPITDSQDLATRAQLDLQQLSFLARAGALSNLVGHRHQAHWEVAAITAPLPIQHTPPSKQNSTTKLLAPSKHKDMLDDYRYTGLTLGQHPMALLREHSDFYGFSSAEQLAQRRPGQFVRRYRQWCRISNLGRRNRQYQCDRLVQHNGTISRSAAAKPTIEN